MLCILTPSLEDWVVVYNFLFWVNIKHARGSLTDSKIQARSLHSAAPYQISNLKLFLFSIFLFSNSVPISSFVVLVSSRSGDLILCPCAQVPQHLSLSVPAPLGVISPQLPSLPLSPHFLISGGSAGHVTCRGKAGVLPAPPLATHGLQHNFGRGLGGKLNINLKIN